MELCDDRELRAIILARIGEKGQITFVEYMGACLYEPGLAKGWFGEQCRFLCMREWSKGLLQSRVGC